MSLTPADLEWIRQLPERLTPEQWVTVRLMRRRALCPSELRLVTSVMRRGYVHDPCYAERQELTQRRAYLERALSQEGRAAAASHEAVARRQLEQALTATQPRTPGREIQERAQLASRRLAPDYSALKQELVDLNDRLAEISER